MSEGFKTKSGSFLKSKFSGANLIKMKKKLS